MTEKELNEGKWYREVDNAWLEKLNHCIVGKEYRFHADQESLIRVTEIRINERKFRTHEGHGWYAKVTIEYIGGKDKGKTGTTGIEHFWNGSWGLLRDKNLEILLD
jgi:hypothetical protein